MIEFRTIIIPALASAPPSSQAAFSLKGLFKIPMMPVYNYYDPTVHIRETVVKCPEWGIESLPIHKRATDSVARFVITYRENS